MTIWKTTGEIVPSFHLLGGSHTPSYLWTGGTRPVLFDAGFSFMADLYIAHARQILGDRKPEMLFLTHAHFDHCGAVSAMQEAFSGLKVGCSEHAANILKRPKALKLISSLNEEARLLVPLIGVTAPSSVGFRPFSVDRIFADGDRFDLGDGQEVQVLSTPGHTRDFLSFYLPGPKILIASEAVGCAGISGDVMVEFISDYDAYLASMQRLRAMDVNVLCQGHLFVYTGDDARDYMDRSLLATVRFREWVEQLLDEEHGNVERVVARVKAVQWEHAPEPKQPEHAYLLNTCARVEHLAGLHEK